MPEQPAELRTVRARTLARVLDSITSEIEELDGKADNLAGADKAARDELEVALAALKQTAMTTADVLAVALGVEL